MGTFRWGDYGLATVSHAALVLSEHAGFIPPPPVNVMLPAAVAENGHALLDLPIHDEASLRAALESFGEKGSCCWSSVKMIFMNSSLDISLKRFLIGCGARGAAMVELRALMLVSESSGVGCRCVREGGHADLRAAGVTAAESSSEAKPPCRPLARPGGSCWLP